MSGFHPEWDYRLWPVVVRKARATSSSVCLYLKQLAGRSCLRNLAIVGFSKRFKFLFLYGNVFIAKGWAQKVTSEESLDFPKVRPHLEQPEGSGSHNSLFYA